MNYKSLDSAIRSVINSQPKTEVKEDYQTRERDRQMANTGKLGSSLDSKEKASKKVYGKDGQVEHKSLRAMIKNANWKDEKNRLAVKEDIQTSEREQEMSGKRKKLEKRFETSAMLPKDSLGIWAHGKKDAAEKNSKQMYGKGGKVVKKTTTMKEEQEYIAMLEFALESIAEELECDVEDLLEDVQTSQRKAEGQKAIKNLSRTRARKLKSWTKHPNPGSSGYYDAEDRFDKANSAKAARQDQQSAEQASSDTYGKGGKIIKKGKVQKPIEKKGDYVYSHYRDEIITKEQALKDRKSKK